MFKIAEITLGPLRGMEVVGIKCNETVMKRVAELGRVCAAIKIVGLSLSNGELNTFADIRVP